MATLSEKQLELLVGDLGQLTTFAIGRHPDNQIVIRNGKISGKHALLIQCTTNSFLLEDLNSKNGTFVNGTRITRKIIDKDDRIKLADDDYTVNQLLLFRQTDSASTYSEANPSESIREQTGINLLDFTREFAALQQVYEQYPKLRRDCRSREKLIRTGSIILSSVVGVGATLATGGGALPFLHIISSAGLGVLIPTLCSTLLSTEEKLEFIDKEYRERYRCPNPTCRDPFSMREWDLLAQQKTCRRCHAIWVK